MRFDVLTLFPEIFTGYLNQPMLHQTREQGLVGVYLHNFGNWALSKDDLLIQHQGQGKLLQPRPIVECLNRVRKFEENPGQLIMLTPQGRRFDQSVAEELVEHERLILLCGRYAGFDPRLRDQIQPDEISVGDYTLHGGEVAALAIIDTMVQLMPSVRDDE